MNVPSPPSFLDPIAREEWQRIFTECRMDVPPQSVHFISIYCHTYSELVSSIRLIKKLKEKRYIEVDGVSTINKIFVDLDLQKARLASLMSKLKFVTAGTAPKQGYESKFKILSDG